MRLLIITLVLLTMPAALVADEDLSQDGVPDAAENVAEDVEENTAEPKDEGGLIYFLLFIGCSVTFVLTIIFLYEKARRAAVLERTRLIESAASELGLSVQAEGDSELEEELSSFPLFGHQRGPELRNLIVADTADVSLRIFDYKYEVRRDGPSAHVWQTVVAVQSPELQIPTFHLFPEGAISKLGSALGVQDIDFDDHPEFSKAFVLKSEAENETRDFFDLALLDFFAQHPDITFEGRPGTALYFRSQNRIDPTATALRKFMDEGLQALHAIRDRVAADWARTGEALEKAAISPTQKHI
jgi:hypothetical protein